MASLSPANLSGTAAPAGGMAPQHFLPPTPRELRAQAMHRLQIGGLGLAAMLLLVGLANIIMDRARVNEAGELGIAPEATASAMPGGEDGVPAGDPLADIGVVPDLPADKQVPASAASPGARTNKAPTR